MSELMSCSPYIIAGLKDVGDLPKKRVQKPVVFRRIIPDEIFANVSKYLDIPIDKIKKKSRKRELVYARKLCVYLIRQNTTLSLNEVGSLFIGTLTDHTSVLHCQKFIMKQISGNYINYEIVYDLQVITDMIKGVETVKFNHLRDN